MHRRSPLLAVTLLVGVFGLAGMPLFVGFMGKLSLLTAAWTGHYYAVVIIAMINSAIAIYYYLQVVRQAVFGEKDVAVAPLVLDWSTRLLCVLLIAAIVTLGVAPASVLAAITSSLAG